MLQGFADATPEKNRLAGGTAHKQTVDYIYKTLKKTHHYKVERQAFSLVITGGTANFTVDGTLQNSSRIDYSPSGDVEAALVPIANVGCDAVRFPSLYY